MHCLMANLLKFAFKKLLATAIKARGLCVCDQADLTVREINLTRYVVCSCNLCIMYRIIRHHCCGRVIVS